MNERKQKHTTLSISLTQKGSRLELRVVCMSSPSSTEPRDLTEMTCTPVASVLRRAIKNTGRTQSEQVGESEWSELGTAAAKANMQ